jgi:hypothetical protein
VLVLFVHELRTLFSSFSNNLPHYYYYFYNFLRAQNQTILGFIYIVNILYEITLNFSWRHYFCRIWIKIFTIHFHIVYVILYVIIRIKWIFHFRKIYFFFCNIFVFYRAAVLKKLLRYQVFFCKNWKMHFYSFGIQLYRWTW